MGIFSWKATTKNGFGKYCVNNNACIMTDFYKPILKGGHTHYIRYCFGRAHFDDRYFERIKDSFLSGRYIERYYK